MVKHDTTSYGKPRSTRGTPMAAAANKAFFGICLFSILGVAWFNFWPGLSKKRDWLMEFYDDPLEWRERKHKVGGIYTVHSSKELREEMEKDSMPNLPNK